MEPVHSNANWNFLEGYIPGAPRGDGNYSNTNAATVQLGIHSLLSRESAHTSEVP